MSIQVGNSQCVYTALIGGYEVLNEQHIRHESACPFICFTDNPDLQSDTWEIRLIKPTFARDPIRSQRIIKIRAHHYLPEFAQSLYIDNTVLLNERPEVIIDSVSQEGISLAMVPHSFRNTVMDEFLAVSREGMEDNHRLFEQMNHYLLDDPEALDENPWWGGFILRSHLDPDVIAAMEIWVMHVMRYGRRDQLSANVALRQAAVSPHLLNLNNHKSDYHTWPHSANRDRKRGDRDLAKSVMPFPARLRAIEIDLERSRKAHQIEVGSLREEVKHLKVQLDRARRGSSVPITSEKEVISSISDAAMNTYPISIRIGSCRVGQQQVGAFELVGVDAQGNDVIAGIFRGRIIKDRPGAVSSDVSIFVRSEGKAVAGLTLSDPPPNGGTFLSVAIQSQGTIASCRLMYGEDGSGPGGKGRAIYITT